MESDACCPSAYHYAPQTRVYCADELVPCRLHKALPFAPKSSASLCTSETLHTKAPDRQALFFAPLLVPSFTIKALTV